MSTYVLFAGEDYYPSGGAADHVGVFQGAEDDALAWAESVDVDAGKHAAANWKHLARLTATKLEIIQRWDRDHGQWEVDHDALPCDR